MNQKLFLCKGVLTTPLPEYQVIHAKAPEAPIQVAAPAPGATPAKGPIRRRYDDSVERLVVNLGLSRPDAEKEVRRLHPGLYKVVLDEEKRLHDAAISQAMKTPVASKAGTPSWNRGELAALVAETMGISVQAALCRVPAEPPPGY